MTLLVTWTGIDTHGPASVYIATDSRLTWGAEGVFDHAVKTYIMHNFPAIFGYCGDALACQMIIAQTCALISSVIDPESATLSDVAKLFARSMARSYGEYPRRFSTGSFTVVVCGKKALGASGNFECYRIDSNFEDTSMSEIDFPSESGPLVVEGSGAIEFQRVYAQHCVQENPNRSTSRDVFHSFMQAIQSGAEATVGPVAQIVSVIRKPDTGGFHCGIVSGGRRYINGQLIDADLLQDDAVWFNENFEITDPATKRRMKNAKTQPQFGV